MPRTAPGRFNEHTTSSFTINHFRRSDEGYAPRHVDMILSTAITTVPPTAIGDLRGAHRPALGRLSPEFFPFWPKNTPEGRCAFRPPEESS